MAITPQDVRRKALNTNTLQHLEQRIDNTLLRIGAKGMNATSCLQLTVNRRKQLSNLPPLMALFSRAQERIGQRISHQKQISNSRVLTSLKRMGSRSALDAVGRCIVSMKAALVHPLKPMFLS